MRKNLGCNGNCPNVFMTPSGEISSSGGGGFFFALVVVAVDLEGKQIDI